jgi:transposase
MKRLADAIADSNTALPEGVRAQCQMYLAQIKGLNARAAELDQKIRCAAKEANVASRLQTMPGMAPITALAIETFAPDLTTFRRELDFAAWLGLVPKQHSTGGKG